MRTYDDRQIEKPLKRCAKCGRDWYMLAVICAECRDPYAEMRLAKDARDVQGTIIDGP